MRKILSLIFAVLISTSVQAQTHTLELMGLGLPAALAKKIGPAIGDSGITATSADFDIKAAADGSVRITNVTGTPHVVVAAGTPSTKFKSGSGSDIVAISTGSGFTLGSSWSLVMAPYTATTAATPVADTNACYSGTCIVPTAAANNAVLIGSGAAGTTGEHFWITNSNGTNLIRAKALGSATINGAVAGGYIGLAANTSMHCFYQSASNLVCDSYTGGAMPTPAGP